uniref:Putative secreted peptide n=1 Tax=Anopheles braziliensis TaxID=58242 RepID=A0A2M3ZUT4_9DIPT
MVSSWFSLSVSCSAFLLFSSSFCAISLLKSASVNSVSAANVVCVALETVVFTDFTSSATLLDGRSKSFDIACAFR